MTKSEVGKVMNRLAKIGGFVCVAVVISALATAPASAQHRGHGGPAYHGPARFHGGRGPRGFGGPGPFVGGALLGLGVGALVGGALAPPPPVVYAPPPPGYYYPPPPVYYGY